MTRLSLETKNKLNDIDWLYEQYITKNKYSRIMYQKHNLNKLLGFQFKEEWTETENMVNAGYSKLYDCGNYKFRLEIDAN